MRPVPPETMGRGLPRSIEKQPKVPKTKTPIVLTPKNATPMGALSKNITPKGEAPSISPFNLQTLASTMELPADELSSSILQFIRYFSLPMDKGLLKNIRKEALSYKNGREAIALATCAAHAKDVELNASTITHYAAAIDPCFSQGEQGGGSGKYQNKEKKKDQNSDLDEEEPEDSHTILRVLNSRPDSSGTRWVVIPFSFIKNNIDYTVSIRVLLRDRHDETVESLTVDISWEEQRRTIQISLVPGQRPVASLKIQASNGEGRSSERSLRHLESMLQICIPKLKVSMDTDGPSFFDCRGDLTFPVDEEV